MKALMIDDQRTIANTTVARNYADGIRLLEQKSWDILYLDHDLGDFKDGQEFTGYHILCWLEENTKYLPKKIIVITANPSARKKMELAIEKMYE